MVIKSYFEVQINFDENTITKKQLPSVGMGAGWVLIGYRLIYDLNLNIQTQIQT